VRRDRQAKARTAQARAKANRRHRFYKTAGWKKLRRRVLANAEHRCQRCGAEGVPLNVHHVRPVEQYPALALARELDRCLPPLSQAGHDDLALRVAFVLAFAAGAILTMLADTMMPEAYEHGGKLVDGKRAAQPGVASMDVERVKRTRVTPDRPPGRRRQPLVSTSGSSHSS
jgi:hypothetical protein